MSDYFIPLRRIAIITLVGYAILGVIAPLFLGQETEDARQTALPETENYAFRSEMSRLDMQPLPITATSESADDVPIPVVSPVVSPVAEAAAEVADETLPSPTSPYEPTIDVEDSVFSTVPINVTPVSWSNSCGYYRIERRMVYDEEEVTTYQTRYQPVQEVRQVTRYRPQWITETRQRTYTVRRPIVETSCREETYSVCRPVTRTECRERTYQVSRWVQESSVRQETYQVRSPRWEEGEREVRETILEPVDIQEMRERVYTVQDPVVSYRSNWVDQGAFIDQVNFVEGRTHNRLTMQSGDTILNPATGQTEYRKPGLYWVPVQEPGHYSVQKVWQPSWVDVKTPVTSYVPRQVCEQVPVTVRRMEPREIVRSVPYREMRYVTETAVREIPVTNWVQKTECVTENYPVTTRTWETVEQVRSVPVTQCRWVEEEKIEDIPFRVCKMVPYTEEVCETRYERSCEPVTHTVRKPRIVCYRIPVDACGNPLPTDSCVPGPVDTSSSEPTLAENTPDAGPDEPRYGVGQVDSIAEGANAEATDAESVEEMEIDPNDPPRTFENDGPIDLADPGSTNAGEVISSTPSALEETSAVEETFTPAPTPNSDAPIPMPMPSELRPGTPRIDPPELEPTDRVPPTRPASRLQVI